MSRSRALVTTLLVTSGLLITSPTRAEVFRCAQPDGAQSPAATLVFLPYRFGDGRFATMRYRGLEMHWDALTDSALSESCTQTMKNFASTLVDTVGNNAMGYDMTRIQLAYDSFHRPIYPRTYDPADSWDTTAMVFGDSVSGGPGTSRRTSRGTGATWTSISATAPAWALPTAPRPPSARPRGCVTLPSYPARPPRAGVPPLRGAAMFRTISDFTRTWSHETESTLKILRTLTDASLAQKVTPEGRSLGFLAWHCVTVLPKMMEHAGVPVTGPGYEAAVPAQAADIACEYEKCAKAIGAGLPWTDEMLVEKVPMFGEQWPRGAVLFALIAHQSHHRGQMTVLMRQAGLPVPGVVGPAREEWAAMKMPAQP